MMVQIIARASAALLCLVVAVGANRAEAQFFGHDGELRYGVFAQGAFAGLDVKRTNPATGARTSQDGRLSGFSYGASIGYDVFLENDFFVGIEADLSIGEVTKRFMNSRFDMNYFVSIRARAGKHVADDWVAYVTAGIAFLGLENTPAPFLGTKNHGTLRGAVIGLGAEHEWEHLTLFGEYLYARFENWDFANISGLFDTDADLHMLRFGVKFGTGHSHYHDDDDGHY